jgi:hypothetical protein
VSKPIYLSEKNNPLDFSPSALKGEKPEKKRSEEPVSSKITALLSARAKIDSDLIDLLNNLLYLDIPEEDRGSHFLNRLLDGLIIIFSNVAKISFMTQPETLILATLMGNITKLMARFSLPRESWLSKQTHWLGAFVHMVTFSLVSPREIDSLLSTALTFLFKPLEFILTAFLAINYQDFFVLLGASEKVSWGAAQILARYNIKIAPWLLQKSVLGDVHKQTMRGPNLVEETCQTNYSNILLGLHPKCFISTETQVMTVGNVRCLWTKHYNSSNHLISETLHSESTHGTAVWRTLWQKTNGQWHPDEANKQLLGTESPTGIVPASFFLPSQKLKESIIAPARKDLLKERGDFPLAFEESLKEKLHHQPAINNNTLPMMQYVTELVQGRFYSNGQNVNKTVFEIFNLLFSEENNEVALKTNCASLDHAVKFWQKALGGIAEEQIISLVALAPWANRSSPTYWAEVIVTAILHAEYPAASQNERGRDWFWKQLKAIETHFPESIIVLIIKARMQLPFYVRELRESTRMLSFSTGEPLETSATPSTEPKMDTLLASILSTSFTNTRPSVPWSENLEAEAALTKLLSRLKKQGLTKQAQYWTKILESLEARKGILEGKIDVTVFKLYKLHTLLGELVEQGDKPSVIAWYHPDSSQILAPPQTYIPIIEELQLNIKFFVAYAYISDEPELAATLLREVLEGCEKYPLILSSMSYLRLKEFIKLELANPPPAYFSLLRAALPYEHRALRNLAFQALERGDHTNAVAIALEWKVHLLLSEHDEHSSEDESYVRARLTMYKDVSEIFTQAGLFKEAAQHYAKYLQLTPAPTIEEYKKMLVLYSNGGYSETVHAEKVRAQLRKMPKPAHPEESVWFFWLKHIFVFFLYLITQGYSHLKEKQIAEDKTKKIQSMRDIAAEISAALQFKKGIFDSLGRDSAFSLGADGIVRYVLLADWVTRTYQTKNRKYMLTPAMVLTAFKQCVCRALNSGSEIGDNPHGITFFLSDIDKKELLLEIKKSRIHTIGDLIVEGEAQESPPKERERVAPLPSKKESLTREQLFTYLQIKQAQDTAITQCNATEKEYVESILNDALGAGAAYDYFLQNPTCRIHKRALKYSATPGGKDALLKLPNHPGGWIYGEEKNIVAPGDLPSSPKSLDPEDDGDSSDEEVELLAEEPLPAPIRILPKPILPPQKPIGEKSLRINYFRTIRKEESEKIHAQINRAHTSLIVFFAELKLYAKNFSDAQISKTVAALPIKKLKALNYLLFEFIHNLTNYNEQRGLKDEHLWALRNALAKKMHKVYRTKQKHERIQGFSHLLCLADAICRTTSEQKNKGAWFNLRNEYETLSLSSLPASKSFRGFEPPRFIAGIEEVENELRSLGEFVKIFKEQDTQDIMLGQYVLHTHAILMCILNLGQMATTQFVHQIEFEHQRIFFQDCRGFANRMRHEFIELADEKMASSLISLTELNAFVQAYSELGLLAHLSPTAPGPRLL